MCATRQGGEYQYRVFSFSVVSSSRVHNRSRRRKHNRRLEHVQTAGYNVRPSHRSLLRVGFQKQSGRNQKTTTIRLHRTATTTNKVGLIFGVFFLQGEFNPQILDRSNRYSCCSIFSLKVDPFLRITFALPKPIGLEISQRIDVFVYKHSTPVHYLLLVDKLMITHLARLQRLLKDD